MKDLLTFSYLFVLVNLLHTSRGQLENHRPLRGILRGNVDTPGASFSRDSDAPLLKDDIQVALQVGFRKAVELDADIEGLRSRTGINDMEQSTRFLFSFRKAEPAAQEASTCMGQSLLEASKFIMARFNLTAADINVFASLNSLVNGNDCKDLMPKGCKGEKTLTCSRNDHYRTIDGTCNNLKHPKWGSAMTPFVRYLLPAYEDGVDSMRGLQGTSNWRLPSARRVSYFLHQGKTREPHLHISLMLMQWGQFLDHDITHTPETAGEDEERDTIPLTCCKSGQLDDDLNSPSCRPIDVSDDPTFSRFNRTCMRFVRSLVASKGCVLGPREQLNQITAYIDGSNVYGSTDEVAGSLRVFLGGQLRNTKSVYGNGSNHLLPEEECTHSDGVCFKAGDERVNEQPGLASMHTLWLRVHNGLVRQFAFHNPHWSDETLYQESRRVVSSLIQQITYGEFLPVILGEDKMREHGLVLSSGDIYEDVYDRTTDASIANSFATAAYRFGHTLIHDILRSSGEDLPLQNNFMNPHLLYLEKTRPSALLEGLTTQRSQAIDAYLVDTLTNRLFAGTGDHIGLDLMALNIQRGRDHGLPSYNAWRAACDLSSFRSFQGLGSVMSESVVRTFKEVYKNVEDIDLFPAGLAENPIDGGLLGPTFTCILAQQFESLKKGDRYWYERGSQPKPFTPDQLRAIRSQSLASIMCHYTDIENMQPQPFFTTHLFGNRPQPCQSYSTLDTRLWKETQTTIKPRTCQGVGLWRILPGIAEWCQQNCFHIPAFCPSTHCHCSSI